jgi:LysM repeat protein
MRIFWILALTILMVACLQQTPTPTLVPPTTAAQTVTPTAQPPIDTPLATIVPTETNVAPAATQTPVAPGSTPTAQYHIIQFGDALSGIALEYGVTVDALMDANGIDNANLIQVGQKLIIPYPTLTPTITPTPTITATPDVPPKLEIVELVGRGNLAIETVVIENQGRSLSLRGWTLRDQQGNVYVFPNLYLGSGGRVQVRTRAGQDTPEHLHWGLTVAAWGEAGDTIVLADQNGVIYASRPAD